MEKVGFYLATRAQEPISIGQLAKALRVGFMTARRRLEAWAAANRHTLEPAGARSGGGGRPSALWLLRPGIGSSSPAGKPPVKRPGKPLAKTPEPPPALVAFTDRPGFSPDENRALDLLALTGTARTSELAQRLQRNPLRIDGLMRALLRKLHAQGTPQFTDEQLPSGETLYRALKGLTP